MLQVIEFRSATCGLLSEINGSHVAQGIQVPQPQTFLTSPVIRTGPHGLVGNARSRFAISSRRTGESRVRSGVAFFEDRVEFGVLGTRHRSDRRVGAVGLAQTSDGGSAREPRSRR